MVDAELAARDAVFVQRDDDGGRHVVGAGDENPLACALDAVHIGERCECVEVDGGSGDERHPLVGLHRRREVCGGVEGDDPPVVDDCDAVAEAFSFFHEVADQQKSDAGVLEVFEQTPHLAACARVESGCQFVEDGHLRIADECQCHRKSLLLPARELAEVGALVAAHAESVE